MEDPGTQPRKIHSLLPELLERLPDAMLVVNEHGHIVAANAHAETLFGYEPQSLLGRSLDILLPDRFRDRHSVHHTVFFANPRGRAMGKGLELFGLRKDGSEFPVEISLSPLPTDEGVLVFSSIRDISARRLDEEQRQKGDEQFRLMVDGIKEYAIFMLDVSGHVVSWNAGAERMKGYRAEEIVGKHFSQFYLPKDINDGKPARELEIAAAKGRFEEEGIRVRKDGSQFIAYLIINTLCNKSGKLIGFVKISRDVSERRHLEQRLRQAQKMEAVGRLAGGVAHDFNNLLGVIIGYSEIVEDRLKPDDSLREKMEEIKKAALRGASLTRQLLAFSRQQVFELKVLNLNAVIADMRKLLPRLIGEDIELVMNCEPNLALVKADQGQIEQVIMNLAVNARDAMPHGGKLVIETANIVLDEFYARQHDPLVPGSYVMLTVTDTGTGMDAGTQSHIFEPFFTTKEPGKGTGLGLATVYGIVKQSGGYIWVYSEPGQGTTFKIYLPQVQGETETKQPRIAAVKIAKGTETILVVEDEEALRKMTRELLVENGYEVLEAGDGVEALEIARQRKGPIHLLLTDVVMPRMGGPALAQPLAVLHPEVKVLYLSGYTGHTGHGPERVNFASELLPKPFTRDALLRKVRERLGS